MELARNRISDNKDHNAIVLELEQEKTMPGYCDT